MQKQWATSSKKNKSIYCLLVNTGCKNNVKSLDTDFFVFKQEVLSFDFLRYFWTSQVSLVVTQVDITDVGSIPGLGRSPGEGHSNPLQYSWMENPMGREA